MTGTLRALGVEAGMWVMVHASMRSLRALDGGADALLDAIEGAIGMQGTMCMMIAADDSVAFDPTTAAAGENGVLAEVFRCREGVLVNDHPACRFAAFGPDADILLHPQPFHDYYGPGSPLARFYEHGGAVLRFGADIDTVTLTHYAEYLAQVPNKRRVTRRYTLAASGGVEVHSLDDSDGIAQWPHGDYFAQILHDYLSAGHAQTTAFATCAIEMLDARQFVDYAVKWLNNAFGDNARTA